VLGFFAGSVYILVTLNASKGEWKVFWMGARADRSDSKE
jgi:hypothetical protein